MTQLLPELVTASIMAPVVATTTGPDQTAALAVLSVLALSTVHHVYTHRNTR